MHDVEMGIIIVSMNASRLFSGSRKFSVQELPIQVLAARQCPSLLSMSDHSVHC